MANNIWFHYIMIVFITPKLRIIQKQKREKAETFSLYSLIAASTTLGV